LVTFLLKLEKLKEKDLQGKQEILQSIRNF
jgi:hypothetical protein